MVKIGLERINIEEGVTVKMLLDNGITELIISLEFMRKQRFKIKKLIYILSSSLIYFLCLELGLGY